MRADRAIVAGKVGHTLAWYSIEYCMEYLLYAGFVNRTDRRAAVAAAVVGGETLIFAANGFRCPLTDVAESLGADDGSVTDIFLPRWIARNLPAIHVPLILLAVFLHGRNLRERSPRRTDIGRHRQAMRLAPGSLAAARTRPKVSTASAN
jgi:hypothetical protein